MSTTGDHKESQVYEIGYLVLPSIPEDKLSEVVTNLKGNIEKEEGELIDGEDPIEHNLAYPMSKTVGASKYVVETAYLGWVKFDLEPSKIERVKASLEAMPEILRFLVTKAPRETVFTFAQALEQESSSMSEEAPETEASSSVDSPEEVVE